MSPAAATALAQEPPRPDPGLGGKLRNGGPVRLYATAPPRAGACRTELSDCAVALAERTRALPVDGFVLYDLQDESARNPAPRPFPFTPRSDPRRFAAELCGASGRETITFKCVGAMDEREWERWLSETAEKYDLGHLSLVGRPVSRETPWPLSLPRAYQIAASHPAAFALGGITIAERHDDRGREIRRLFDKQATGCQFFISQTVYDAGRSIELLRSYARECRRWRARPGKVVLSFSPCGGARTLDFMKWLGIAIPPATESAILASDQPLTRSIGICRDNLGRILDAVPRDELDIGYCVESVSTRPAEVEASIDLFESLYGVAARAG